MTTKSEVLAAATAVSKDQLMADFRAVITDADALIKATANQGGEALAQVRAKAESSLAIARAKMTDVEEALIVRTRAAVKATDVYVHQNPWQSIGAGAALGVLIGYLMGRR